VSDGGSQRSAKTLPEVAALALTVTDGRLADVADGGIALRRTIARERLATTRALNLSVAEVPVPLLAACAAGAVLASMLAAAVPARRAARVDVLRALATE
jgi:putative ABC transport system permease protein